MERLDDPRHDSCGRWTLARIESTNLNVASWFEMDAVIEDEAFGAKMEEIYLKDLTNATESVLDEKLRVRAPGNLLILPSLDEEAVACSCPIQPGKLFLRTLYCLIAGFELCQIDDIPGIFARDYVIPEALRSTSPQHFSYVAAAIQSRARRTARVGGPYFLSAKFYAPKQKPSKTFGSRGASYNPDAKASPRACPEKRTGRLFQFGRLNNLPPPLKRCPR